MGNNYLVAQRIASRFNCDIAPATSAPSLDGHDQIVVVLSNTGDEELPQPMEDFLYGLTVRDRQYAVCELGNYFGFENYSGCKKVAIKLLDRLGWHKVSDVSLDSLPTLDIGGLDAWLDGLKLALSSC